MGQTWSSLGVRDYLQDLYEYLTYSVNIPSPKQSKPAVNLSLGHRHDYQHDGECNDAQDGETNQSQLSTNADIVTKDINITENCDSAPLGEESEVEGFQDNISSSTEGAHAVDLCEHTKEDNIKGSHDFNTHSDEHSNSSNKTIEGGNVKQKPSQLSLLLPEDVTIPELEGKAIKYHTFVAHSDDYKEVADSLVENLEQVGFKCFLHSRDFIAGKYITTNIEDGINESLFVVFILTKDFLNSPWGEFEIQMALHKCIDTKKATVIPLVIDVIVEDLPLALKTINCINYKDQEYWPKLCRALTAPRPLQHSLEDVIKENIELCIIKSSAVFQNIGRGELDKELCVPAYPMEKTPRGKALIISNIHVVGQQNRQGGEIDEFRLSMLFQDLDFEVVVERDLSTEGMRHAFKHMGSQVDHKNYSCFVACLLSHGSEGGIYGSDGTTVSIQELAEYVDDRHCESLQLVPKLFFVQGCLGTLTDNRLSESCEPMSPEEEISRWWRAKYQVREQSEEKQNLHAMLVEDIDDEKNKEIVKEENTKANESFEDHDPRAKPSGSDDISDSAVQGLDMATGGDDQTREEQHSSRVQAALIPRSEDFLMSYSCLPGYMSWRNTHQGSWYCIALDKCMRKYSNPPYNWDLDRVLKMVSKEVKDEVKTKAERYQFPFHVATMYKAVYLPFTKTKASSKKANDECQSEENEDHSAIISTG